MEDKLIINKKNLKGEDGYKTFSVRIKEETVAKLNKLSQETNRSRNELINILLDYAIDNNVPLFGICLGMQSIVTQFARRNGYPDANSSEFDDNLAHPVIDMMEEQKKIKNMGGTMRLGSYDCKIVEGTKTYDAYGEVDIEERHRHRFEFNNDYRDDLTEKGLIISGTSPDDFLVEIVEVPNHPWAIGCQFHPEFKSRPNRPHPLFKSFLEAIYEYSKN